MTSFSASKMHSIASRITKRTKRMTPSSSEDRLDKVTKSSLSSNKANQTVWDPRLPHYLSHYKPNYRQADESSPDFDKFRNIL